jgi:HPt (histidine-containing phosphotransfer) domain-containing protein
VDDEGLEHVSCQPGNKSGDCNRAAEPLDLEHLRRSVASDLRLELEVLQLFRRQANEAMTSIRSAREANGLRDAAHTLRGSALAVGAWRVAELATVVEAGAGDPQTAARALADLDRAVLIACAFAEDRVAAAGQGEMR